MFSKSGTKKVLIKTIAKACAQARIELLRSAVQTGRFPALRGNAIWNLHKAVQRRREMWQADE